MSYLSLPGQIVLHLPWPNVSYIIQILQTALASSGRLRALMVLGENLELCQSLEQIWYEAAQNIQDGAKAVVQKANAQLGVQTPEVENGNSKSGGSHSCIEGGETHSKSKLQLISLAGVEANLVALSSWLNVWIQIEANFGRKKPLVSRMKKKISPSSRLFDLKEQTPTWQVSLIFDPEVIAQLLRTPSVAAAVPDCAYLVADDLSNHGNVLRRFWLQLLSAVQPLEREASGNRMTAGACAATPSVRQAQGGVGKGEQVGQSPQEERRRLLASAKPSPAKAMGNPSTDRTENASSANNSISAIAENSCSAYEHLRIGKNSSIGVCAVCGDRLSSTLQTPHTAQDILHQWARGVPDRSGSYLDEGFNYLFWASPIGIVCESLDGGILSANPAFCRLTGYTETQLRHLDRRSITHPEDFATEVRVIQQMLNSGAIRQTLRKRYMRSDGEFVTAEVSMSLLGVEEEESYLLSFVTDLSDRQRAELEIQQRREREALLSEISAKIRATFDLSAILQTAVQRLREALDTDRVLAYQLLRDNSGVCIAEDVNPIYSAMKGLSFPAECIPPPYLEAYRCGRLWSVADVRAAGMTDCHQKMLEDVQVRSTIAVAIQRSDESSPSQERVLWGLLTVHHCRAPRCWTPDEQQLVQAVGNQIAIAIEQANLVHQLQAHAIELEDRVNQRTRSLEQSLKFERLSRHLTETLRGAIDEDQMLRAAVEGLGTTLGVDGCYASLFDERQEVLEVRYQHSTPHQSRDVAYNVSTLVGERFSLQDWPDNYLRRLLSGETCVQDIPIEQTVDLRQAIDFVDRVSQSSPVSGDRGAMAKPSTAGETPTPRPGAIAGGLPLQFNGVVSQLISPILDERGLIGTLSVFHACPRCFEVSEIELVEQVTAQCAIAIRQARLYRQEYQQRLSAEYFRLFLQQSTDVFVEYDQQLRYLSINPAGASLLGMSPAEIIGKTNRELIGEDSDTIESIIRQVFNTGEKVIINHEVFIEGDVRTFETVYAPIASATSSIHRVIGIGQDVTEVRRQWQQLQEQNQQLAEINRLKEEFIATTSHELRTPLTAILGFSSVLIEEPFGPLNPKQKLYIDRIHSSGQHLLELINDILDLSRIEADRLELEPQLVFIRDICQSVISLIQERVSNHGLTLEVEVDPDLEYMVADPRRIKQMLLNLLTNAIKFTPQGTVGLKIYRYPVCGHSADRLSPLAVGGHSAFWRSSPTAQTPSTAQTPNVSARKDVIYKVCTPESINFLVWDTGIGIDEADQLRLFSPFSQIDSSLARQYQGTGLGLVITRKLAELHGGYISLESASGKGSRFTISLPLYQSPQSSDSIGANLDGHSWHAITHLVDNLSPEQGKLNIKNNDF